MANSANHIQPGFLDVGKSYSGYLCLVHSAEKFYIQLQEQEERLNELMSQLSVHFTTIPEDEGQLRSTHQGVYCVAKFSEDGVPYRAKIESVNSAEGTCLVRYIDYGNSEIVDISSLKTIRPDMCDLGEQAICCRYEQSKIDDNTGDSLHNMTEVGPVTVNVVSKDAAGLYVVNVGSMKGATLTETVFSAGSTYDVYVSFVTSCGEFWVQPVESEIELTELMAGLREHLTNNSDTLSNPGIGIFCLACYSEDGAPYRAKICKIDNVQSRCTVLYVDYGNVEDKDFSELKIIPDNFCLLPSQAVLCSMPGSENKTEELESLETSLSIRVLKQNANGAYSVQESSSSTIQPTVLAVNETYEVYLSFIESSRKFWIQLVQEEKALKKLMEELSTYFHGLASGDGQLNTPEESSICTTTFSEDGSPYRATVLNTSADKCTVRFLDYGNEEKKRASDLRTLPPQLCELSSQAVCCGLSDHECLEVTTSTLQDIAEVGPVKVKVLGHHQDNRLLVQISDCAVKESSAIGLKDVQLAIGSSHDSYIAFVESTSSFWIQLVEYESALSNTMADLSKQWTQTLSSQAPVQNPAPGQCCATCFSEDGVPYRAKLQSIDANKGVVLFVDYGNSEMKNLSDLKPLPPQFLSFPTQAVHCCYNNRGASPKTEDELHEMIEVGQVSIKVIGKVGNQYNVETVSGDAILQITEDYTLKQVKAGTIHNVCVSYVEHPGNFCIQLLNDASKLDDLMVNLSSRFQSLPQLNINQSLQANIPCVAKFSDGEVYRAKIKSKSGSLITIEAVDFGHGESTSVSNLRAIDADLHQRPIFAIKGTISKDKLRSVNWSSSQTKVLKQYESKSVLVAKLGVLKDGVWEVDLYDTQGKTDVYLTEAVQNAKPEDKVESTPEIKPVKIGQRESIGITAVDSDKVIYGQLLQMSMDALETMQVALNKHFNNTQNAPRLCAEGSNPEIGAHCCIRYSVDSNWYRAQVVSVCGSKVVVFFIDYGDSNSTTVDQLFALKPEFNKLPQYCVRCKLSKLNPNLQLADLRKILVDNVINVDVVKNAGPLEPCVVELTMSPDNKQFAAKLLDHSTPPRRLMADIPTRTKTPPRSYHSKESYNIEKLDTGSNHEVFVTHVVDPQQFHCQLISATGRIDSLMESLHDYCCSLGDGQGLPASIHITMPCLAKYSADEKWYRVKVTGILSNGLVEVEFVDYGNTEIVTQEFLRATPAQFLDIPAQGILCGLSGISPPQGFWSPEHSAQFEDLILDQRYKATFEGLATGNTYSVELFDDKEDSVNRAFAMKTGSVCIEESFKPSNRSVLQPQQGNTGLQIKVSNDAGAKSLRQPQSSSSASDVYIIERLKLQQGAKVSVCVVYVISPFEFWCQISSNSIDLDRMMEELNAKYEKMSDSGSMLVDVKPGAFCCAKFTDDQRWYRAQVVKALSGEAEVQFVDYGNSEIVASNVLRKLNKEFCILSMQGIKCRMTGVEPVGSSWSEKAAQEFEEHVLGQSVFISVEGGIGDELRLVSFNKEANSVSVAEFLVDKGFAVSKQKTTTAQDTQKTAASNVRYSKCDIKLGNLHDVFISWVISPETFWCQIADTQDQLEQLTNSLQTYYSSSGEQAKNVAIGMPVVARFSEDDAWYRAVVTGVNQDKVSVTFVDYGNSDTVFMDAIRVVAQEFFHLPCQALLCSIRGINLVSGSSWKPEAKELIENLAIDGATSKFLEESPSGYGVQILANGKDVAVELINANLASSSSSKSASKVESPQFSVVLVPEEGSAKAVYVAYTKSPMIFWCQFCEFAPQLEELMSELDVYYSEVKNHSPANIKPNSAVVAKYSSDEMWYRATMMEEQNEQCSVYFVDYGNTESISKTSVLEIDAQFVDLPMQAFKCSLKCDQHYKENANQVFTTLVLEKELNMKVLKKNSDFLEIELMDDDVSITNMIVGKDNGEHQAVTRVPEVTSPDAQFVSAQIPLNNVVSGFVTVVESPYRFFLQFAEEETQLNDLMEKIASEYADKPSDCLALDQVCIGQPCCTLYSVDDLWYRAKITSIDGDSIHVMFVDYGNSEMTSVGKLKAISAELLALPPLAYECCLSDVLTAGELWTAEAIALFETLTLEKELSCTFVTEVTVRLSTTDGDVGNHLVEAGHAQVIEIKTDSRRSTPTSDVIAKGYQTSTVPQQMAPSDSVTAYVSHVDSDRFYVQLQREENQLEEITHALNCMKDAIQATTCDIGTFYCCKYSVDDAWYRCQITKRTNNKVAVQFVDYGNADTVSATDIKVLNDELCIYPPFAYECTIGGLTEWSEAQMEVFKTVTTDKELRVTFHTNQSPYQVILSMPDDNDIAGLMAAGDDVSDRGEIVERLTDDGGITTADGGDTAGLMAETKKSKELPVLQYRLSEWKDTKMAVYVSHIVSPAQFWCQPVETEMLLTELMNLLEQDCSQFLAIPESQQFEVGDPCVAKFSDGGWYRGTILAPAPCGYEVLFVDYGNSAIVDRVDVTPCILKYTTLPIQAMECSLGKLRSPDDGWSEECIDHMMHLTTDKQMVIEIVEKTEENGTCRHFVLLSVGDIDVGQSLIRESFAVKVRRLASLDDSTSESEKSVVTNNVVVTDHADVANSLYATVVLCEGNRLHASICHVLSPSQFWIHLSDNVSELEHLQDLLYEYYTTLPEDSMGIAEPCENLICAAPYDVNEGWYRAIIRKVFTEQVEVFFIDHGNTSIVPLQKLKRISMSFMELPAQAIECALVGLKSEGRVWASEAISSFRDLVTDKDLVADIVGVGDDGSCIIQLLCMGLSITQSLLDHGVGVLATTPVPISKKVKRIFSDGDTSTPLKLNGHHTLFEDDDMCAEVQRIQRTNFPTGKTVCVKVTEDGSPGDFWCMLVSENDTSFDQLEALYGSERCPLQLDDPKPGQTCVIQYTLNGQSFHRARIMHLENLKTVVVRLVDKGVKAQVEISKVRVLEPEFLVIEQQAFCGILAAVRPPVGDIWDEGACCRFKELVCNKELEAGKVMEIKGERFIVELYDGETSISQTLIDEDIAVSQSNLAIENSISIFDLSTSDISDSSAESSSDSNAEFVDCDDVPTEAVKSLTYPYLELNVAEEVIAIVVEENDSPDSFYIKLDGPTDIFDSFMADIETYVNDRRGNKDKVTVVEGDACLVHNSTFSKWYRGLVEDITTEHYMVLDVDTGFISNVTADKLMPIPQQFRDIPRQVAHCRLPGLCPLGPDNQWSEDSLMYFTEYCIQESLIVYVKSQSDNGVYDVNMCRMDDAHSVNYNLFSLGYASALPEADLQMEIELETTINDSELLEDMESSFCEMADLRRSSYGAMALGTGEAELDDADESFDVMCNTTGHSEFLEEVSTDLESFQQTAESFESVDDILEDAPLQRFSSDKLHEQLISEFSGALFPTSTDTNSCEFALVSKLPPIDDELLDELTIITSEHEGSDTVITGEIGSVSSDTLLPRSDVIEVDDPSKDNDVPRCDIESQYEVNDGSIQGQSEDEVKGEWGTPRGPSPKDGDSEDDELFTEANETEEETSREDNGMEEKQCIEIGQSRLSPKDGDTDDVNSFTEPIDTEVVVSREEDGVDEKQYIEIRQRGLSLKDGDKDDVESFTEAIVADDEPSREEDGVNDSDGLSNLQSGMGRMSSPDEIGNEGDSIDADSVVTPVLGQMVYEDAPADDDSEILQTELSERSFLPDDFETDQVSNENSADRKLKADQVSNENSADGKMEDFEADQASNEDSVELPKGSIEWNENDRLGTQVLTDGMISDEDIMQACPVNTLLADRVFGDQVECEIPDKDMTRASPVPNHPMQLAEGMIENRVECDTNKDLEACYYDGLGDDETNEMIGANIEVDTYAVTDNATEDQGDEHFSKGLPENLTVASVESPFMERCDGEKHLAEDVSSPIPVLGKHIEPTDSIPEDNGGYIEPIDCAPEDKDSFMEPTDSVPEDNGGYIEPIDCAPEDKDSFIEPTDSVPEHNGGYIEPIDCAPEDKDSFMEPTDSVPKDSDGYIEPADIVRKEVPTEPSEIVTTDCDPDDNFTVPKDSVPKATPSEIAETECTLDDHFTVPEDNDESIEPTDIVHKTVPCERLVNDELTDNNEAAVDDAEVEIMCDEETNSADKHLNKDESERDDHTVTDGEEKDVGRYENIADIGQEEQGTNSTIVDTVAVDTDESDRCTGAELTVEDEVVPEDSDTVSAINQADVVQESTDLNADKSERDSREEELSNQDAIPKDLTELLKTSGSASEEVDSIEHS